MLALTGTADKDTKRTVVTNLIMRNPRKLFVSWNIIIIIIKTIFKEEAPVT